MNRIKIFKEFVMKKSQRFSNMHPNEAGEFGMNWDWDLSGDDFPYHMHKTSCSELKARRNRHKSVRDMHIDDVVED